MDDIEVEITLRKRDGYKLQCIKCGDWITAEYYYNYDHGPIGSADYVTHCPSLEDCIPL